VTAQINATGTIASVALDIPFQYAVYVGLISILLCSMLGGMRGVTWTQVAQYIVLIIAYLLPVFWISNKIGAGFFPHFMLADEVARIGELEQQFGFIKNSAADLATVPKGLAGITKAHSEVNATPWAFISLALAMMMGTASLPHVMMRFFTTPSVKAARKSVGWSVFFIFLLYSSAPMLATLSKLALIDPNLSTGIIGKSITEVQAIDWYQNWNQANLMFVSDFNGNGTVELNEFFMGGKAVVLATPEIAGLPYVISGLVAAGGLGSCDVNCRWFNSSDCKCNLSRRLLQNDRPESRDCKTTSCCKGITCNNWFRWCNYCSNGDPRNLRFSNMGF
jgi:cation/acetate symporter